MSSTISMGSVRNLKTKIKKSTQGSWTTVGKYSQKKKERWSSKVAPPSSDLPKLAELIDKKAAPEDQQLGEDVDSNIDQNAVTNTEHDGADVEDRDGPPEDEEDAEPAATKEAHQGAPMSPAIFGFHDLPSTNAASPTSPRQVNAAPSSSKNTPSQAITPCVDSPRSVDRSNSTNAVLGGEDTAPEEKSENSGVIFVEGTDSKCEVSVVVPLSEVLAALESELPLDAASTSEYSDVARLRTPKSMRSTVLVEGADNVSTTTGEDAASAAKDDGIDEDEGEDVYEEEGDYDGSIADESNAHFAPRRNKNKAAGRPKNDKERTIKAEKRRGTVNEKTLRHAHRQACKYLKKGDFALALEKFEDILSELTSSLGDSHRRVASALHNVGVVNIRDNNLDDAIDALEEAIRIRKDVHGTDHPKVADSLLELGIALLSQKEHEEALEIFNDALDIREADLDQEARHGSNGDRIRCALQVARVLNNIGCVYFEYGSLSKALKTFQEDVLQLQKYAIDELSQNDPEYKQAKLALATTYCNIGYVHTDNSDYDDAIAFLDKAYAIQTKHLPEGSEISLSTLENLAYANYKEKNLDIALEMYQDILLDQIELYGRYDISCAQTLHNKACIQIRQCKYQEALDQLNAAEAIQLDILGAKSRRLRKTRVMISEVEDEMSKLPAVTEIFNRAMTRGGMTYPFTNTLLCQCDDGELSKLASFGNFQLLKPDSSSKMSGHKISYA